MSKFNYDAIKGNLEELSKERNFSVEELERVGVLYFKTVSEVSKFMKDNPESELFLKKLHVILSKRGESFLGTYIFPSFLSNGEVFYVIRYKVKVENKIIKYENIDLRLGVGLGVGLGEEGVEIGIEEIKAKSTKKTKSYGLDTVDYSKPVYVVEGVFDRVRLETNNKNVISLLGTELTPYMLRVLTRFSEVYLTLDSDSSGSKAIEKIKERLRNSDFTGDIYAREYNFSVNEEELVKDVDDLYRLGYKIEDVGFISI